MRIELFTTLSCPPARAWDEVLNVGLLRHVAYPLAVFTPIDPPRFPEKWSEGEFVVGVKLGGFLPFGRQVIRISFLECDPERAVYRIRDNGGSAVVKRWDHVITIRAGEGGGTHYTDTVDIEAGWLTPLVWLYARAFYAHRQRRWRELAARGFENVMDGVRRGRV